MAPADRPWIRTKATIEPMKVLRVSHSAVVDAWRDRERELRALGFEVRTVSARTWAEGGRDVRLEPRADEPVVGVRTWGSHPALFLYGPVGLWRALRGGWDVLDIHEEPYALATVEVLVLARLRDRLDHRRRPYLVYTAQNVAKRHPWPFRRFETAVLRGAAGLVACNTQAGRIARQRGLRGRLAVVPLGVDRSRFPAVAHDERAHDGVVVGYAGRLTAAKGVDTVVEAIAGDRQMRLRVAGDGPERAALEELADRVGARVEFLGSLDTDGLAAFYQGLDVLAVPSRTTSTWVEQFGRVAVEAMSAGTPVVASDSGALPDVVGGAGLVVPEDDISAWRKALRSVGTDRVLAERLRRSGFDRADACTWERVALQYGALYDEVGGPPTKPAPPEVVLVAYHTPELVRGALEPLAGALPVTVVDNSSSPAVRRVAEDLGVRYLDPGRNGGFAAGVNHALAHRATPGSDVLLLNPDAKIALEDVARLQTALHAERDLASVGPTQDDGSGEQARVYWPFLSPGRAWLEAVGLGRFPSRHGYVVGSVLLLRAAALEGVGPFDERYFLYAEETDWAYRAHRIGWRHAVAAGVHAQHLGGATSGNGTERTVHFHASQELYLRKHYGAAGWASARTAMVAGALVRSVLQRGERATAARRRAALHVAGPARVEQEWFTSRLALRRRPGTDA
jgi:glycosyltransferase involved in cell wall biosynthesis/GT2 family glycosyltransferase